MTGPAFDPLAGYTPDWRKKLANFSDVQSGSSTAPAPDDPLAGYTPNWRELVPFAQQNKAAVAGALFAPPEAHDPIDPAVLAGAQETAAEGIAEGPFSRAYHKVDQKLTKVGKQLAVNVPEMAVMGARDIAGTAAAAGTAILGHPREALREGQKVREQFNPALEKLNEAAGGAPEGVVETAARMIGPLPIIAGMRGVTNKVLGARAAAGAADDVLMRRIHSAPSFGDEAIAGRFGQPAEGMPNPASSGGESMVPSSTSRTGVPPLTQADPSQSSVTDSPLPNATMRETLDASVRRGSNVTVPAAGAVGSIGPSGRMILHPTNNVEVIHSQATQDLPMYRMYLDELAQTVPGAQVVGARVKELGPRLMQKIEQRNGEANTVTDYIGGRIATDDVAGARALAQQIEARGGKIIDADDFIDNGNAKDGYRAIHVLVQRPNGMSAELQIAPREIAEVQEEAHKFYDLFRDDKISDRIRDAARSASRQIFDDAWGRFKARTGYAGSEAPAVTSAEVPLGQGKTYYTVISGRDKVVRITDDLAAAQRTAKATEGRIVPRDFAPEVPAGSEAAEALAQLQRVPEAPAAPILQNGEQIPPKSSNSRLNPMPERGMQLPDQQASPAAVTPPPTAPELPPLDADLQARVERGFPEKTARQMQKSREHNRARTEGPPQGFAAAFRELEERQGGKSASPAANLAPDQPLRVEEHFAPVEAPLGTPTRIEGNTGATDAAYTVLPADRVIASNRATDLGPFDVDARHPGNERTYAAGSDQHHGVLKQAGEWNPRLVLNTDPTAVGGPPIVVPWTQELARATGKNWDEVRGTYWTAGGNSRVMAQDLLRQRGRGAVVDAANRNAAEQFGLSPDQMGSGNLIVRVASEPVTTVDQAKALVSRLNETPTKALAVEEAAVSAGQKMTPETRDWFGSVYDADKPIRENLQSTSVARELRDRLTQDGVLDASNRARYFRPDGTLTEEGKTFIERMLLGRAVPDAKLLQTATPAMVSKIERVATLIDRSGAGGEGYDLRPALAEILRRQGGQNVNLARHLAQADMLQGPPDELVTNLWGMFDGLSAKELRERLGRYVDVVEKRVVRKADPDQVGFGLEDPTPVPSPGEAWETAKKPFTQAYTNLAGANREGVSGARLLASMAGGGAAGAAVGGSQGDTPGERARNALIGLGAGLAGGGILGQARRMGPVARELEALEARRGMAGRKPPAESLDLFGQEAPQADMFGPRTGSLAESNVGKRPAGYQSELEKLRAEEEVLRRQGAISAGEIKRRPELRGEQPAAPTEHLPGQQEAFGLQETDPALQQSLDQAARFYGANIGKETGAGLQATQRNIQSTIDRFLERGVSPDSERIKYLRNLARGERGAVGSRDPAQVDAFTGAPRTAIRVGETVVTGNSRKHYDLWHERGRTGRITPKQYQEAVSRGTIEEGFLDAQGQFVPKARSNRRGAVGSLVAPEDDPWFAELRAETDRARKFYAEKEARAAADPLKASAIKLGDGRVITGEPGELHGQIYRRHHRSEDMGDYLNSHALGHHQDGFVRESGEFVSRKDAGQLMGIFNSEQLQAAQRRRPTSVTQFYRGDRRGAVGSVAKRPDLELQGQDAPPPTNRANQAVTLWKTGLLTNPKTHIANITGNTAMAGLETAKDLPAALVDRIISVGTGRRTKSFSPAGTVAASWRGAKKGVEEAKRVLKHGQEPDLDRWDVPPEVDFKNPILRAYTQGVMRALAAPDAFFRKMALERSLAEARRLGPITEDVMLSSIADAEYAVFQGGGRKVGEQSRIARAGEGFRKELGPVGHVIAPFTRTPGNIVGATIDYSPFGAIRGARDIYRLVKATKAHATPQELRALQKAASEQIGRTVTGTSAAALGGYLLARSGKMTGARPTDKKEQDQWNLAGKQENAVKIGGKWHSLNRFSPIGNLMALGANYYYLRQNPEATEADAAMAALGSVGTTASEQSFLQGVQEVNKAINDPKGQAGKYGKNLVASVVPAAVGATARAMDPVIRDTKGGFFDALKARVPGVSKTLPAQVDQLGNEKRRTGGPAAEFLDPTTARDYRLDDPVIRELEKTGAQVAELNPGRTRPAEVRKLEAALRNTKAPHTRALLERRLERAKQGEERGAFLERSKGEGGALNRRLQQIIGDPNYQRLPLEARKEVLDAEISRFRRHLGQLRRKAGR